MVSARLPLPALLEETRVLAILRGLAAEDLLLVAEAIVTGGVRALELSLAGRSATSELRRLSDAMGDRCAIGAGTVMNVDDAVAAADAGAAYLVTPHSPDELGALIEHTGLPVIAGAMTPTEILRSWRLGASAIKLFPAGPLGAAFLADVRGPFPEIPFMAVGGVDGDNADSFFSAGARYVASAGWLVGDRDPDGVAARARELVSSATTRRPDP